MASGKLSIAVSTAYAVWDRLAAPTTNANPGATAHAFAFRGPTLFSRTTDSGATWSRGRVIFDPGQNDETSGNQIVVPTAGPAKGVLIDGMSLITNKGGKCPFRPSRRGLGTTFTAAIIRSADGGNTWSDATGIDVQQVASVSVAGTPVRFGDFLPEFATNPVTVTEQNGADPGGSAPSH